MKLFRLLIKENNACKDTDLMEDVIPEELEHISVPELCPSKVLIEFCSVNDGAQLCHETEQPSRLHVFWELRLQKVRSSVHVIQLGVEASSWERKGVINVFQKYNGTWTRKIVHGVILFLLLPNFGINNFNDGKNSFTEAHDFI